MKNRWLVQGLIDGYDNSALDGMPETMDVFVPGQDIDAPATNAAALEQLVEKKRVELEAEPERHAEERDAQNNPVVRPQRLLLLGSNRRARRKAAAEDRKRSRARRRSE